MIPHTFHLHNRYCTFCLPYHLKRKGSGMTLEYSVSVVPLAIRCGKVVIGTVPVVSIERFSEICFPQIHDKVSKCEALQKELLKAQNQYSACYDEVINFNCLFCINLCYLFPYCLAVQVPKIYIYNQGSCCDCLWFLLPFVMSP